MQPSLFYKFLIQREKGNDQNRYNNRQQNVRKRIKCERSMRKDRVKQKIQQVKSKNNKRSKNQIAEQPFNHFILTPFYLSICK